MRAPRGKPLVAPGWLTGAAGRNTLVALLFFVALTAFVPRMLGALDPLTGDEPFYVMTAISIAGDGDIEESNNYASRDYLGFYPPDPLPPAWRGWPNFPRSLVPHAGATIRPGVYSWHGLGVPLVILVPYALGGRLGVVLLINVVAALVALNIFLLTRRYTPDWRFQAAICAALAFSSPLMSYAYLIFPEVFAALAIIYAFRRSRAPSNGPAQWLLVGLALALLPWLHARFVPVAAGLALALLPGLVRERDRRCLLAVIVPPAIAALALAALNWRLYGQLTPNYGRPLPGVTNYPGFSDLRGTINGFFGLFLDEQWGLLIYAPIYALALIALAALWRAHRRDALALLAVAGPYLLLLSWFRIWWGEWGPPARYLAPLTPLAAAPLASWAAQAQRPVASIALALWSLPGFAIMAGFLVAPQLMYNHPTGHSALFVSWAARLGGREWPKVIPSFQFYAPSPTHLRVIWSLALIGIVLAPFLINLGWRRGDHTADKGG